MEMTTRDEIALALTCAIIAGGYGPGDSGSFPFRGYELADEFITEMTTQQAAMDLGLCYGKKNHQPYTHEDGSVTCYRCNQVL